MRRRWGEGEEGRKFDREAPLGLLRVTRVLGRLLEAAQGRASGGRSEDNKVEWFLDLPLPLLLPAISLDLNLLSFPPCFPSARYPRPQLPSRRSPTPSRPPFNSPAPSTSRNRETFPPSWTDAGRRRGCWDGRGECYDAVGEATKTVFRPCSGKSCRLVTTRLQEGHVPGLRMALELRRRTVG
jgi:hypothetical protein